MGRTYTQRNAPEPAEIVPIRGLAVLIRDRLADRRQVLDDFDELGALDTTATVLAELHDATVGRVPGLAADRTPRYRRGQFTGESSLPLEDFVWLLLADVAAGRLALEPLLLALGRRSVPREELPDLGTIPSEAVDLIGLCSHHLAEWTRHLRDGIGREARTADDGPARRFGDASGLRSSEILRRRLEDLDELVESAERLRATILRTVAEQEASP
jgi:hypothetical protein